MLVNTENKNDISKISGKITLKTTWNCLPQAIRNGKSSKRIYQNQNRSSCLKSSNCFQCNFVDIGLWNSIYKKFHCWMEQGVFEKNITIPRGTVPKLLSHWDWFDFLQSSSTHKRRKKIFGNQNIGVSRGGKTTKIHALVNEYFQLVALELSSGNLHDRWL